MRMVCMEECDQQTNVILSRKNDANLSGRSSSLLRAFLFSASQIC